MAGIAVKGTYRNGVIELEKTVQASDGEEVLVVFQEQSEPKGPRPNADPYVDARRVSGSPADGRCR